MGKLNQNLILIILDIRTKLDVKIEKKRNSSRTTQKEKQTKKESRRDARVNEVLGLPCSCILVEIDDNIETLYIFCFNGIK